MKNKPTIKNDLKFSNKPWSMGTSASVTLETPVGSAPPKKGGVVEPRQAHPNFKLLEDELKV